MTVLRNMIGGRWADAASGRTDAVRRPRHR